MSIPSHWPGADTRNLRAVGPASCMRNASPEFSVRMQFQTVKPLNHFVQLGRTLGFPTLSLECLLKPDFVAALEPNVIQFVACQLTNSLHTGVPFKNKVSFEHAEFVCREKISNVCLSRRATVRVGATWWWSSMRPTASRFFWRNESGPIGRTSRQARRRFLHN